MVSNTGVDVYRQRNISYALPKIQPLQRHSRLRAWHARLGHRDFRVVARLRNLMCPRRLPFCHQCAATKSKASPNREPAQSTERPLQKLHMDLVPLPAPSLSGSHHVLTITDDYSSYVWLRFTNTKTATELARVLDLFLTFLRTQFPQYPPVARVKTDRGTGEFVSNDVLSVWSRYGIHHMPALARTHEVNGRVERLIQTLKATTLVQLLQADLHGDMRMWPEAYNVAAYIHNILPTPHRDFMPPHEALYGQPWSLGFAHMKPFGCLCYAHDSAEERNQQHTGRRVGFTGKTAPRGRSCLFIGYVHTTTKRGRSLTFHVGIFRDVVFDEESFPRLPASPIPLSQVFDLAKPPSLPSIPRPDNKILRYF